MVAFWARPQECRSYLCAICPQWLRATRSLNPADTLWLWYRKNHIRRFHGDEKRELCFEGERKRKKIYISDLLQKQTLTYGEVKDFSLQTSDSHAGRAPLCWPFQPLLLTQVSESLAWRIWCKYYNKKLLLQTSAGFIPAFRFYGIWLQKKSCIYTNLVHGPWSQVSCGGSEIPLRPRLCMAHTHETGPWHEVMIKTSTGVGKNHVWTIGDRGAFWEILPATVMKTGLGKFWHPPPRGGGGALSQNLTF